MAGAPRLIVVALLAISPIGCAQAFPNPTDRMPDGAQPISLATDPPAASNSGCPLLSTGGTLVRDARTGFAVSNDAFTQPMIWPYRYTAAIVDGKAVLFDAAGDAVAKEGDQIRATGWEDDSSFHACAGIERV